MLARQVLLLHQALLGKAATTATTVAGSTVSTAKPVSVFSLMLQLALGLAVVLGLIWAASKVLRGRVTSGARSQRRRSAPINVVARQTMGKGVALAVVEAGEDTWLVGLTANQITRIARYRPAPGQDDQGDELPAAPPGLRVPDSLAGLAVPLTGKVNGTIRRLQERTLRRS